MSSAAITIENLSFAYHRKPLLANLSVSVEQGMITGILGPNGCGKSTLVKLVDGLLKPDSGRVLIGDVPTLSLKPKQRARLLSVLTQSGRVPAMDVFNLVACGRYPYQSHQGRLDDEDRAIITRAIAEVGLAEFTHRDIRRLSGGERQRAFVALSLAQDTDIIVLDEPTTYLDIKACHDVMSLVESLCHAKGKTVLMVVHDIDLALRYCDALMVLNHGSLVGCGQPSQVLQNGFIQQTFDIDVYANNHQGEVSYSFHPRVH